MVLAVTGVTGKLGRRIAQRLDSPARLLARTPEKVTIAGDVRQASYGDRSAVMSALDGVDVALMVSASESLDRVEQHRSFIDAAAEAGVRHLVYISFHGASPEATFTLARDHWATEEHIKASGMHWTFLRDNLYADFLPGLIGDDDVIRGPGGSGERAAVAAVAQDDIADVAALVLNKSDSHRNVTYDLTGPHALTFGEIADALSASTGRHIRYVEETVDEAYASRGGQGVPQWQLDAWVSTYLAVAAGEMVQVSADIPTLLGRPARSVAEVLAQQP